MKIAVFHNLPVGGAKRVLYEQVKFLSETHSVLVFTYVENNNNFFGLSDFVKINKYDSGISTFSSRVRRDYQAIIRLDAINKDIASEINKNFDVCLVHTDMYIEAPYILKYLKIPSLYYDQEILATVYNKDFKFSEQVGLIKTFYEQLNRLLRKATDLKNTKSADLIATNSKFMKNHIKDAYAIDAKIIYPGVNKKFFKPYKRKRRGYLFVGNKKKEEGWDFVKNIENIKNLKKNGKKFEVNSDREMAKIYSSHKATICTNPVEAFGLKAIESMACGTPVIAIKEAAYPELISNNKNGYLVNRDNIKSAIKKIENLSEKQYKSMQNKCIETAKKYSWEKHNKAIEKMLLSLANE